MLIKKIYAQEIIDSRGYPAVCGRLWLDNGAMVETSVPYSFASSKYEAWQLKDDLQNDRIGIGINKVVDYINNLLAPKLIGISPTKQKEIDYWLKVADTTENKSRLGANTMLIISQLILKAGAIANNLPIFQYLNQLYALNFKTKITIEKIPSPIFNIINGGKQANNDLNFQEFQIIPSSSLDFGHSYLLGIQIYHLLKQILIYRKASVALGDQGGFTPYFTSNIDAIEIIKETINNQKLKLGLEIFLGIDFAASSYYANQKYLIKEKSHPLNLEAYYEYLNTIIKNNTLMFVEDPFESEDLISWQKINEEFGKEIYIVGDDLTGSNFKRVEKIINDQACNAIIIKPYQIGTITEMLELIEMLRKNSVTYIISAGNSETNDDVIADISVALQPDFIKFGAPSRGERVCKYNRLWDIERNELRNQ
jgi:enolase